MTDTRIATVIVIIALVVASIIGTVEVVVVIIIIIITGSSTNERTNERAFSPHLVAAFPSTRPTDAEIQNHTKNAKMKMEAKHIDIVTKDA